MIRIRSCHQAVQENADLGTGRMLLVTRLRRMFCAARLGEWLFGKALRDRLEGFHQITESIMGEEVALGEGFISA